MLHPRISSAPGGTASTDTPRTARCPGSGSTRASGSTASAETFQLPIAIVRPEDAQLVRCVCVAALTRSASSRPTTRLPAPSSCSFTSRRPTAGARCCSTRPRPTVPISPTTHSPCPSCPRASRSQRPRWPRSASRTPAVPSSAARRSQCGSSPSLAFSSITSASLPPLHHPQLSELVVHVSQWPELERLVDKLRTDPAVSRSRAFKRGGLASRRLAPISRHVVRRRGRLQLARRTCCVLRAARPCALVSLQERWNHRHEWSADLARPPSKRSRACAKRFAMRSATSRRPCAPRRRPSRPCTRRQKPSVRGPLWVQR